MSDDNNNILDNLTEEVIEETIEEVVEETPAAPVSNNDFDDFDFVDQYSEAAEVKHENQLDDNETGAAINVGIIGIGGGGGKIAKAFLDLGFNKTLLINTTEKDQPLNIDQKHFVHIPGSDGAAKDINIGKKAFNENGAVVEDAIRTKFGKVDWLIVCAGGGGGTGSSTAALSPIFDRYLESIEAEGKVLSESQACKIGKGE